MWSIHTNKESEVKIQQLIRRHFDHMKVEINYLENKHTGDGQNLLEAFLVEIKRCLDTGSKLLLAPPDTIFGDGTLTSLFLVGSQSEVCVAVAHPRVLPSILEYPEEIGMNGGVNNAELVSAAWRHLHKTWEQAELGFDKINSHVGGVCWKTIKKGLYSVQHRLPTNYLIHFHGSDLTYFHSGLAPQLGFGIIDHHWPSKLIQEQRQRTIGSSDSAFIVEVTKPGQNMAPYYPVYKQEPDKFWRSEPHNIFFRQVCVVFRGVEA